MGEAKTKMIHRKHKTILEVTQKIAVIKISVNGLNKIKLENENIKRDIPYSHPCETCNLIVLISKSEVIYKIYRNTKQWK